MKPSNIINSSVLSLLMVASMFLVGCTKSSRMRSCPTLHGRTGVARPFLVTTPNGGMDELLVVLDCFGSSSWGGHSYRFQSHGCPEPTGITWLDINSFVDRRCMPDEVQLRLSSSVRHSHGSLLLYDLSGMRKEGFLHVGAEAYLTAHMNVFYGDLRATDPETDSLYVMHKVLPRSVQLLAPRSKVWMLEQLKNFRDRQIDHEARPRMVTLTSRLTTVKEDGSFVNVSIYNPHQIIVVEEYTPEDTPADVPGLSSIPEEEEGDTKGD